jgi:predicted  nucleic acid-binding Zn-ribbon protein
VGVSVVEKLPVSKIRAIIRLYLNGLSYSEIAAKVGVSKGTVSNVIADLKAGKFPEAGDVSEQIELLHDLAIDLKKYRMTAGQATVGVSALTRLHELGLEPTDLERVKDMSRSLPPDTALPGFMKAALAFDETYRRTGLSFGELETKIAELEETASRLEPLAKQTKEQQHQVEQLNKQQRSLTAEIGAMEKRLQSLTSTVKEKEARDLALDKHVSQLEQRAHDADERLGAARKNLQILASIGLSLEDLTGFTHRLSGIAQRHGIKRVELRERLLGELEQLQKGLRLESEIKKTQEKLVSTSQLLSEAREELATTKTAVETLHKEKASLQVAIKETEENVRKELMAILPIASETVTQLKQQLTGAVNQALAEILELRKKALEVGKEIGCYQTIINVNDWLRQLTALVASDSSVNGEQVKANGTLILRAISAWLNQQPDKFGRLLALKTRVNATIEALEQWKL